MRKNTGVQNLDILTIIASIDAAVKALNRLERALDHNDRRIAETELWNARQELNKLREALEATQEKHS